MAFDILQLLERLAAFSAERRGIRTDCQRFLDELRPALAAEFGAVTIESPETGELEVVASAGLDAAAFRRLERRASSSALMRVFDLDEPTFLLVNDEPTLDFLALPLLSIELIVVPIKRKAASAGYLALAFDKKRSSGRREAVRIMEIAASLISQVLRLDEISSEIERLAADKRVVRDHELRERYDIGNLIGNSTPMRQAIDQAGQIARSNVTVMLRGESGTGKDRLATAIHYNSLRAKRPFIKLSPATLSDRGFETEFFGSDLDGNTKTGQIDEAKEGTVLLNEIASLGPEAQAMLLRLVQDGTFLRSGSSTPVKANVRLFVATAADLEAKVAKGEFREDLFYSLSAFTIFVPPLRDRKADILLLADHFVEIYSRKHRKHIRRISTAAIDMLALYHFPGNVRELENAIERSVILCDSGVLHARHLPPTLQTAEASGTANKASLERSVAAFERDLIEDALKSSRGNIAKAARHLDSTERILGYKIKAYGIEARRYK